MKNFVFDSNPKCCGGDVTLQDANGKPVHYKLKRVKNNGCIFSVIQDEIVRDEVVFTMLDLKALFCLLTSKDNGQKTK